MRIALTFLGKKAILTLRNEVTPMKKTKIMEAVNRFGMPVTTILLGLILLLAPDSASVIIAYLVGGILTLGGLVFGIGALLDRSVSKGFWALVCLGLGSTLAGNPLLLARNLGRFLGIWLAIEGGDCLRKGNRVFGVIILVAAVALVLSPMTLSRLVFSACGLVVLILGIVMLLSRIRDNKFLPKGDDNIIDAL